MSRDGTRTRDSSGGLSGGSDEVTDVDLGLDEEPAADEQRSRDRGGLTDRVATRAKRVFSPRHFFAALALSAVGLVAARTLVPLPASGLLGVFVATFLFGLAVEERRYAEAVVAGGVVAGTSFLFGFLVFTFLGGLGVAPALLGAGLGAVVALAGTYFGRDLRQGLTRDVP